MKEFTIIESRAATYYWEYIVKAKDANEALSKVQDGNIEASDAWCEEDDSEDSDFEITENE